MSISIIRAWDDSGAQHLLDIKGKQSFPTTFQLADVLDLKNSKSGFNKSIDLPATDRNVDYFGQFWDVNNVTGFDPKTKKRAILEYDTVKVLDGWIQLVEVKVENGRTAEYNVRLFSEESQLFKTVNKKLLRDLDLTLFDHEASLSNVAAGFTGDVIMDSLVQIIADFTTPLEAAWVLQADGGHSSVTNGTTVELVADGASTDALLAGYGFTSVIGEEYTIEVTVDSIGVGQTYQLFIGNVPFLTDIGGTATGIISGTFTATSAVGIISLVVSNRDTVAGSIIISSIVITKVDEAILYYGLQDYGTQIQGDGDDTPDDIYAATAANKYFYLRCKPYLKLMPIFDQIMKEAGYTYESTFLSSTYAEKLYMLAHRSGGEMYLNGGSAYFFKAGITSDLTIISASSGDYTEPDYDDESSFDFQDPNGVHASGDGFGGSAGSAWRCDQVQYSVTGFFYLRWSSEIRNNSASDVILQIELWRRLDSGTDEYVGQTGGTIPASSTDILSQELWITADEGYWYVRVKYISGLSPDVELLAGEDTFFECYDAPDIPLDDLPSSTVFEFVTADNVPQETLQSDVLEFFDNRFNLLFIKDKIKQDHFIIEPYNDYVGTGERKDWSSKLDISKTYSIKPMSAVEKKEVLFTTKEGNDILNKLTMDNAGRIYGRQRFINDVNEFSTGTKKVECPDVVSPLNAISDTEIMIPRLYTDDISPVKGDLRVFVKGGLYDMTNAVNGTPEVFKLRDSEDNLSAEITEYTHFGHYGEPIPDTDNTDLNFGKESPYQPIIIQPTDTAYERYWRTYLDQIYGDEARMLVGHFNLSLADIEGFLWSDKIFCLNAWWVVNKISGFDPLGNKSTKVELIRFSNALSGLNSIDSGEKPVQATSSTFNQIK